VGEFVPSHWHPYVVNDPPGRRRYRQGRLAEYPPEGGSRLTPEPRAVLLASRPGDVHELEPAAIPASGLRLERRPLLVRSVEGSPVLWIQRRRLPLLAPPANALAFDATDPAPP